MIQSYTAKYTKLETVYMGQLVEWPEVVTEGNNPSFPPDDETSGLDGSSTQFT